MYPDLGGPFGSLQEAEAAVNRHLDKRRLPEICQKPSEGPCAEWLIKQCLYYPDGTPKRGPNAPRKNSKHHMHPLVKAVVDQYNDYNNLYKVQPQPFLLPNTCTHAYAMLTFLSVGSFT